MSHREFCCNDLPPKGLVFSMSTFAVLLGLGVLALGYGLLPMDMDWLRAPRWIVVGAGVMFIFGGIAISLVRIRERRDRTRSIEHLPVRDVVPRQYRSCCRARRPSRPMGIV
jgi:tellurite resistance protein TehA-like permease